MYKRPQRNGPTLSDQLSTLNTPVRPGLYESEFLKLWAKCTCGLIMTRRVFRFHVCVDIINISSDSDVGEDGDSDSDADDDDTSAVDAIDLTIDE